jgi:cysteine desulfuration protein SufE
VTAPAPGGAPASDLSPGLTEIVEEFAGLTQQQRLELLLDFSRELPAPPERFSHEAGGSLERVAECQSPIYLAVELDGGAADDDSRAVHLFFDAPAEAPTTKGFAGILREGLDGRPAAEVLATPADVSERLGLAAAISPLRLRGMAGMLGRIKRRVREQLAA